MVVSKKMTDKKIEPGQNKYIDQILAIYPDDEHDIFKIGDKIVLKPKGTTLEEAKENE
jgi:hypothetical protein